MFNCGLVVLGRMLEMRIYESYTIETFVIERSPLFYDVTSGDIPSGLIYRSVCQFVLVLCITKHSLLTQLNTTELNITQSPP